VAGLYEELFCKRLRCLSPLVVCQQLELDLIASGLSPSSLRVLDLGAGNGMVGEELRHIGVQSIVGTDILPEAAEAVERDRPHVYDAYHVLDFTHLTPLERAHLKAYRFNCLACVAALGFADIPTKAFVTAFDLIADAAWIAFNIKEEFILNPGRSPFATLIRQMIDNKTLSILSRRRYRHRLSIAGDPLYYVSLVGRKTGPIANTEEN